MLAPGAFRVEATRFPTDAATMLRKYYIQQEVLQFNSSQKDNLFKIIV
jgi:hypothetical protein